MEAVNSETIRLKTDLPYGLLIIAFRLPGYDIPDYAATPLLEDVMNSRRGDLYQLTVKGTAEQARSVLAKRLGSGHIRPDAPLANITF